MGKEWYGEDSVWAEGLGVSDEECRARRMGGVKK